MPNGSDELTRLRAVQARVRTLARNHGWFGNAIRAAFVSFLGLVERFQSEKSAMQDRKCRLALDLLLSGRLTDPAVKDGPPALCIRVLFPPYPKILDQMPRFRDVSALSPELEREAAAAYLLAMYPSQPGTGGPASFVGATSALGVSGWVNVLVAQPQDWEEPADPQSLDAADLKRFSEADFRAIALYWLGGLADTGSVRPIVSRPTTTGDMMKDVPAYAAWRARFPGGQDPDAVQNPFPGNWSGTPAIHTTTLPAVLAEQLLDDVETWAKGEAAKRGEPLTASGPSVAPNGDTKPPAPPAGAEAIDEHDAALLAFLNRNRSLRRKVSDVLPETGPQDRKAVAKRLRKLADRTPPLVDYPKGGRSGVEILPAGVEALNRTTAPTPR